MKLQRANLAVLGTVIGIAIFLVLCLPCRKIKVTTRLLTGVPCRHFDFLDVVSNLLHIIAESTQSLPKRKARLARIEG